MFHARGVDADLADLVARQVSAHPDEALRVHVREELGVDHHELPSPFVASAASLITFAIGALVPLLPYLFGFSSLPAALILAGIAAFTGGALVARLTDRSVFRGGLRQLLLAGAAAGVTFGLGTGFGHVLR